jgi:hypothetical protein
MMLDGMRFRLNEMAKQLLSNRLVYELSADSCGIRSITLGM